MNGANRLWLLGAAVLCVVILALGWFLGISPRLDEATASAQQQQTVDDANATIRVKTAKLKADYANLQEIAGQLATLRESLPPSADYTGFLDELNAIAGSNHVALASFVPSTPTVATGASPAPAPTSSAAATLADGTLVSIPVTLSATGAYEDLVTFVGDLQKGQRLFLVTGLTITGADSGYSASIVGTMFVQIDSSVASPDDAVNGPQPTQTPTPTSTPAS